MVFVRSRGVQGDGTDHTKTQAQIFSRFWSYMASQCPFLRAPSFGPLWAPFGPLPLGPMGLGPLSGPYSGWVECPPLSVLVSLPLSLPSKISSAT